MVELKEYNCICCDDNLYLQDAVQFHKTRRQRHHMCYECAESYILPFLARGETYIPCPGDFKGEIRNKCNKLIHITRFTTKKPGLLQDKLWNCICRYYNPFLQECPNGKCNAINNTNDSDHIKCSDCETEWCCKCYTVPYHSGQTCVECLLKDTKNPDVQYLSTLNKNGDAKLCPSCGILTIKEKYDDKNDDKNEDKFVGCNKMTCTQCAITWCWLCHTQNIDYDHYNPNNKNFCSGKLWLGTRIS